MVSMVIQRVLTEIAAEMTIAMLQQCEQIDSFLL